MEFRQLLLSFLRATILCRYLYGCVLLEVGAHQRVGRQHAVLAFEDVTPILMDLGITRLVVETIFVHILLCHFLLCLLVQLAVLHAFLLLCYFKAAYLEVGWVKESLTVLCHERKLWRFVHSCLIVEEVSELDVFIAFHVVCLHPWLIQIKGCDLGCCRFKPILFLFRLHLTFLGVLIFCSFFDVIVDFFLLLLVAFLILNVLFEVYGLLVVVVDGN